MRHLGLFVVLISLALNLALAQDKKKAAKSIKWSAQLQQTYKEISGIWDNQYFWDKVAENIPPKFGFTGHDIDKSFGPVGEGRHIEYYDGDELRARLDKNGEVTYYQPDTEIRFGDFNYEKVYGKWITRKVINIDQDDLLRYEEGIFSDNWKRKEIKKRVEQIKFAREEERQEFLKEWDRINYGVDTKISKASSVDYLNSAEEKAIEEWYGGAAPDEVLEAIAVQQNKDLEIEDEPYLFELVPGSFDDDNRADFLFGQLINRAAELQKISREKLKAAKKNGAINCGKNLR